LGIIFGSIASIAILIGIGFLVVLSCDDLEESEEFKKVTEEYSLPECTTIKSGKHNIKSFRQFNSNSFLLQLR